MCPQKQIYNKAFHSLSFRRDYSINAYRQQQHRKTENMTTYGAILVNKRRLGEDLYALVQGRYTGKWSFPKGHSNEGEKPMECTLREVLEETGIEKLPKPVDFIQIGYGNYYLFELEDTQPLIPRDKHEIMDTKWVTLEEMEGMSLNADASLYRKKHLRKV